MEIFNITNFILSVTAMLLNQKFLPSMRSSALNAGWIKTIHIMVDIHAATRFYSPFEFKWKKILFKAFILLTHTRRRLMSEWVYAKASMSMILDKEEEEAFIQFHLFLLSGKSKNSFKRLKDEGNFTREWVLL